MKTDELIGEKGRPIRVLTFAGGGFSTALQLGVAHALLVSRGRAPDVVVGISAGAVNAVALAEILQAGEGATDERLIARTMRFREIFAQYTEAPGQLILESLPDSLQIDTMKPLVPQELPIHARAERKDRERAVRSRSGLMDVYNRLLRFDLPIGMVVRGIRRVLGLKAVPEIRPRSLRHVSRITEVLRLLDRGGISLPFLAKLVPDIVRGAGPKRSTPPEGGSAGELIFRSTIWRKIRGLLVYLGSLTALWSVWVTLTSLVLFFTLPGLLWCGACRAWEAGRPHVRQRLQAWINGRWPRDAGGSRPAEDRDGKAQPENETESERRALRAIGSFVWLIARLSILLVLWLVPVGAIILVGARLDSPLWWAIAGVGAAIVVLSLALLVVVFARRRVLVHNFLHRNAVSRGLLDPHPVRQFLIRLFDPAYYGALAMDDVVESALGNEPVAQQTHTLQVKRLCDYGKSKPAIRVGVAVANVGTGRIETLSDEQPVVDALLAATARVPVFPPQKIGDKVYVDASNIANEPTSPLMKYLRERIPKDRKHPAVGDLNTDAPIIHLYSVSPRPISARQLEPVERDHWTLVEVVARTLDLRWFRDARLERHLTELYTRAMPPGRVVFDGDPAYDGDTGKSYLRTWVYPIEPKRSMDVDRRLLHDSEAGRRKVIAETVADGCRAALETFIQPSILGVSKSNQRFPRCRAAVDAHLRRSKDAKPFTDSAELPGSSPDFGPGVAEVCGHCALRNPGDAPKDNRQRLVPRDVAVEGEPAPPWPREGVATDERGTRKRGRLERPPDETETMTPEVLKKEQWPRKESTVSFVFSGGVFRGVYQVGVLNALSQVGLRPDIVAGASVGSITAAMVARVFADGDAAPDRSLQIQRLAATYTAVDRLVLTDRFADFVRKLTVRGAQTRFSLRQADRVIRQYDQAVRGRFEKEARLVMAGVERLLYVSPFEFLDLLEASRRRNSKRVFELLRSYFQEWLDRGEVGSEVLGAEPLELLIKEHVLPPRGDGAGSDPGATEFDEFLKSGILMLATATNLSKGRLEILGARQSQGDPAQRVSLLEGLLASSAFPGVFRPRGAWEVMPQSQERDLFTDGGVMDNLPLDAVAEFLLQASKAKLIKRRPRNADGVGVPHLLFSASLEANPHGLSEGETAALNDNWLRLMKRAKRLGYNQKLSLYANAQAAIRRIWAARGTRPDKNGFPADLEVLTVVPQWLCGTFAFHPMLGFRRIKQARSIAHGCASTLLRLRRYGANAHRASWLGAWGVDMKTLPDSGDDTGPDAFEPVTTRERALQGFCWFRNGAQCPFSRQALESSGLDPHTVREVSAIHRECGRPAAHRSGD